LPTLLSAFGTNLTRSRRVLLPHFFGYFADKRQVVLNTRKDSGWRVACLVFFGNALDILANNENPVDGVANFFETHGRRF
jgi:hypothetical protein